jgi:hypothetical protein
MLKKLKILFLFFFSISILAVNLPGDSVKTLWSFSSFGEDDFFHRPSDIEVDFNRALIYIADAGNHRVVVFDFDGKFLKVIGKQGQGPGEFSNPTGLHILSDSGLAVADYGSRRIQLFDNSGNFVRGINCSTHRIADLLFIGDEIYTISSYGASGFSLNIQSKKETQPLVTILDKEGSLVRTIEVKDFPESQPFIRALKHRVILTLSKEKKLFLPFFAVNLVHVFDLKGNKIGEFDRPMAFDPIAPKLRSQRSGESKGQKIVQMSATLDFVTRDARIGPDGNLYLLTYTESLQKQTERAEDPEDRTPLGMRFDVIDTKSHKLLRHIECESGASSFDFIGANLLVYCYEDIEGELFLKCIEF